MDILTIDALNKLVDNDKNLNVSIYLPTYSSGVDIRQNPIKFKQLLREVEAKLYNMEMRKQEIEGFLKAATDLIPDTKFWQNQSEGLALFINKDGITYFRLPVPFKEVAIVGQRIYIRPLISLFNGNGQFNILALSKNDVRLFRGTRHNIIEIEMEDAPDSVFDMQVDDDPRTKLENKTSNPFAANQLSYNRVTQAQGNENEYLKNELTRYFRAIDESLMKIHDEEAYNIPMVLAGTEYLIPIYREKSKYPNITDDFIRGNPDLLEANELHREAWKIVEPIFTKNKEVAKEKFEQYYGQKNNLFENSLDKIIPAAFNGRVESLFINDDVQWGVYDHENNKLHKLKEITDDAQDLIEYASLLTLSRGGSVYHSENIEEMADNNIAAVLRY